MALQLLQTSGSYGLRNKIIFRKTFKAESSNGFGFFFILVKKIYQYHKLMKYSVLSFFRRPKSALYILSGTSRPSSSCNGSWHASRFVCYFVSTTGYRIQSLVLSGFQYRRSAPQRTAGYRN